MEKQKDVTTLDKRNGRIVSPGSENTPEEARELGTYNSESGVQARGRTSRHLKWVKLYCIDRGI